MSVPRPGGLSSAGTARHVALAASGIAALLALALAAAAVPALGGPPRAASPHAELPAESSAAQSAGTESIVVVADDRCTGAAGCDAVSVFGLPRLDLVFRGPHLYCSPGRLAADRALSVVVAQPSNGNSNKLLVTRRAGPLAQDWAAELVAAPSGAAGSRRRGAQT